MNKKKINKKEVVIFDKNKEKSNNQLNPDKNSKIKRLEKKIENLEEEVKEKNSNSKINKLQKSKVKPPSEHKKELRKLAKTTQAELFKMSSIFPFDLFPNTVLIEKKQIIVTYKQFFLSKQEYHVLIEDLLMPVVETSILFATFKLELGPGAFRQNPPSIRYLSRKDALEAKAIVTGLLICHKEKIDITELSKEEITEKARTIGEHS